MSLVVNVLYEHDHSGEPHGCSYIRLLRPLSHPSLNTDVRLIQSRQLSSELADVVIVERWWKPGLLEKDAIQLVNAVKQRGATLIYTLDDNLLDLGSDEQGDTVPDEKLRATRYFIRSADGLIVSTPELAQRLTAMNSMVIVVPNALDERLYANAARGIQRPTFHLSRADQNDNRIRIGYMGTLTHAFDLQIIIEPLRKLLNRYADRVRFELVGVSSEQELIKRLFGPAAHILQPTYGAHYEKFVSWFQSTARWDIGLAPLSARSFNRYKSDIKYLDYGILGIPGVFSKFGPYTETVRDGVTGMLVDNHADAWYNAMEKLVLKKDIRRQMGICAFEYTVNERILKLRANDWLGAINKIIMLHREN